MLSEQKNLPSLTRSISFAGITKHSRNIKRLRNRRRFNISNRKTTSLQSNNHHSRYHPYNAQKKNSSVLQTESMKSLFKRHLCSSRKFNTGEIKLRYADMSLNERMIPVLEIADRLQHSLNIEKDKRDIKDESWTSVNPLKNWLLKRHNSENMEKGRSEDKIASQLKLTIDDHQPRSLYDTSAESDEEERTSMPSLGDEFPNAAEDSTVESTVLPSISYEKRIVLQEQSQSCEEQKENHSPNVALYMDSDLKDQLSKLETTSMFECEDVDQDFNLSIIIVPDSSTFTESPDKTTADRLLENFSCSGDIDPDLRDLLCVESPVKKPDADRSSTLNDYRHALTFQDQFTCVFCGTNLEIVPFDHVAASPNDHLDLGPDYDPDDYPSCFPSHYFSHCNELTNMFCPLCCENRLVQK